MAVRPAAIALGALLLLTGCTTAGPGGAAGGSPVSEYEAGNGNPWIYYDACVPVEEVAALTGFEGLTLTENALFARCLYTNDAEQGQSVTAGFFTGVSPSANDLDGTHEGMVETATPTLGTDAKVGIADANCIIALPANDPDGTFGTFSVALLDFVGAGGPTFCDPLLAVTRLFGEQSPDDPSAPTGEPTCEEAAEVMSSPEADSAIEKFASDYFDGDIGAAFDFIDSCGL